MGPTCLKSAQVLCIRWNAIFATQATIASTLLLIVNTAIISIAQISEHTEKLAGITSCLKIL